MGVAAHHQRLLHVFEHGRQARLRRHGGDDLVVASR
jgi:hypothetical protein